MNDKTHEQLHQLLDLAKHRPLTETEQAMLRKLLKDEENRAAAAAQQQLQSQYHPTGAAQRWSAAELHEMATTVSGTVQRRSQKQRVWLQLQQAAWVGAAALGLLLLLIRPFANQPTVEPAVQPTPTATPQPTPTLPSGYRYIELSTINSSSTELLSPDLYMLSVNQALAQLGTEVYLPSQLADGWRFVGAQINSEGSQLELAFVEERIGSDLIWILSQTKGNGRSLNPPLPVAHQPLPRIDETLTYADEETAVDDFPAHAFQYEFVYREDGQVEWVVYNAVTWQQGEQLLTLTLVDDDLNAPSLVATIAKLLQLRSTSR